MRPVKVPGPGHIKGQVVIFKKDLLNSKLPLEKSHLFQYGLDAPAAYFPAHGHVDRTERAGIRAASRSDHVHPTPIIACLPVLFQWQQV